MPTAGGLARNRGIRITIRMFISWRVADFKTYFWPPLSRGFRLETLCRKRQTSV